jgi:hypothetical protein
MSSLSLSQLRQAKNSSRKERNSQFFALDYFDSLEDKSTLGQVENSLELNIPSVAPPRRIEPKLLESLSDTLSHDALSPSFALLGVATTSRRPPLRDAELLRRRLRKRGITNLSVSGEIKSLSNKINLLEVETRASEETFRWLCEENESARKQLEVESQQLQSRLAQLRAERELQLKPFTVKQQRAGSLKGAPQDVAEPISSRGAASVFELRKVYDSLRTQLHEREVRYNSACGDLQNVNDSVAKSAWADGYIQKYQLSLQTRLNRLMLEHNAAINDRQAYEKIIQRLETERIAHRHRMLSLEKALEANSEDFEDVYLLCRDAQILSAKVGSELEVYKDKLLSDRERRLTIGDTLQKHHESMKMNVSEAVDDSKIVIERSGSSVPRMNNHNTLLRCVSSLQLLSVWSL